MDPSAVLVSPGPCRGPASPGSGPTRGNHGGSPLVPALRAVLPRHQRVPRRTRHTGGPRDLGPTRHPDGPWTVQQARRLATRWPLTVPLADTSAALPADNRKASGR
jgi:hypothetical protein